MERASAGATITKIRAIHGRMLTQEDYRILASKKTVAQVAQYLMEHKRFSDVLSGINVNTIHRGYLEELIVKGNFEMFLKLRDFQHLRHAEFYNSVCLKYETQQLLSLIDSIFSKTRASFISGFPAFLINNTKLDFVELSKCASLQELCSKLGCTQYRKPMEQIASLGDNADYLTCEVILRTYYYKKLMSSVKNDLSKSDATLISSAIRSELDVRNIVNAYRMKKYFGAGSEEIRSKQLPFTKLGKAKMEKLYECTTDTEMVEYVRKTSKAAATLFDRSDFIETEMAKINLRSARKLLRTQSMPAVFYAFLQLCDVEAANIIHIIEGIRYELPHEKIEELIAY